MSTPIPLSLVFQVGKSADVTRELAQIPEGK